MNEQMGTPKQWLAVLGCGVVMAVLAGIMIACDKTPELTESECIGASQAESLMDYTDIRIELSNNYTAYLAEPTFTPTPTPKPTSTPTPIPTDTPTPTETPTPTPLPWTREESLVLQKLAYAEAGNQGVEGMAMVIDVVMNRVASPKFPNSIKEVVYQPGQFTVISNGMYDRAEPNQQTAEALQIVLNGRVDTQGALYFATPSVKWTKLKFLYQYKNMCFYTE